MTGWRLGYGIMPAPLAQVVAKLQTNADLLHGHLHAARRRQGTARRPVLGRHDGRRVQAPPRRDRRRPAPDPRLQVPAAAGRLLRVPEHHGHGLSRPSRSPTACSTRPASRACPARPSASGARATCASATRTASRTSRRRSSASRPASRHNRSLAPRATPIRQKVRPFHPTQVARRRWPSHFQLVPIQTRSGTSCIDLSRASRRGSRGPGQRSLRGCGAGPPQDTTVS